MGAEVARIGRAERRQTWLHSQPLQLGSVPLKATHPWPAGPPFCCAAAAACCACWVRCCSCRTTSSRVRRVRAPGCVRCCGLSAYHSCTRAGCRSLSASTSQTSSLETRQARHIRNFQQHGGVVTSETALATRPQHMPSCKHASACGRHPPAHSRSLSAHLPCATHPASPHPHFAPAGAHVRRRAQSGCPPPVWRARCCPQSCPSARRVGAGDQNLSANHAAPARRAGLA